MATLRFLLFWVSPLFYIGVFLFVGFPYLFGQGERNPDLFLSVLCAIVIAINAHVFSERVAKVIAYHKQTKP